MKTQLIIFMFVVNVLLSSCVVTPQAPVTEELRANVYEQPTEEYYVVKRGDTLSSIARGYGISDYKIIARQNNLFPPYELGIGQELVIPLSNQPIYRAEVTPPAERPPLGAYNSIPSYPVARPGCGVQVVSIDIFTHRCRWFSQCTGINYIIKNTSPVARTVTVEYRYLGKIRVLHNNLQILGNDLIDDSAYDVANTVSPQNIVISHCY